MTAPPVAGIAPEQVETPRATVPAEDRDVDAADGAPPPRAEGHDGKLALKLGVGCTQGAELSEGGGTQPPLIQFLANLFSRHVAIDGHQVEFNLLRAAVRVGRTVGLRARQILGVLLTDRVVHPVVPSRSNHVMVGQTTVEGHDDLVHTTLELLQQVSELAALQKRLEFLGAETALIDQVHDFRNLLGGDHGQSSWRPFLGPLLVFVSRSQH